MVADGSSSSVFRAKIYVTELSGLVFTGDAAAAAVRRRIVAGALAALAIFAPVTAFAQSNDAPARTWWGRPAAAPAPDPPPRPSSREVLLGTIITGGSGSDDRSGVADRILTDGLDALRQGDVMLGRRRLEAVIDAYPESAAAATATRELNVLYNIGGRSAPTGHSAPTARWVPAQNAPKPDSASGSVRSVADVASDDHGTRAKDAMAKEALVRERQSRRDERWLKALGFKFQLEVGDRVFFAENSADIGARSRSVLAAQARWLISQPDLPVVIEGHADDSGGNRDFDVQISEQRARAVQERLVEQGLDPSRIAIVAFGRDRPVATCVAPECAAQNRRVVTRVAGFSDADLGRRGVGAPDVAVVPPRPQPARRD